MKTDLSGQVALITGSSSGLGKEIARVFDAAGASVAVNSSTSTEAGTDVARELRDAIYLQADVSTAAGAALLVDECAAHFGRLDYLINNAGRTHFIPLADLDALTDEMWTEILDANLMSVWRLSKNAVPLLRRSPAGSIVNVSSIASLRVMGSSIAYGVSKAAINHLTAILAVVLAPDIRVNAIAPGVVETPWIAHAEGVREAAAAANPTGRIAEPGEIAQACFALATTSYLTGQTVVVDGGATLR